MLEDSDSDDQETVTMGEMLSGDKRTRIYAVVFVISVVAFFLSLIVPENQYDNIDMWLFGPSVLASAASATGLSSRIRVIGERVQKPERVGFQSRYTINADLSKMRSWPLYFLGASMFGIGYLVGLLYPTSYFVEIIPLFGLLFFALGLLLSFLKLLSR